MLQSGPFNVWTQIPLAEILGNPRAGFEIREKFLQFDSTNKWTSVSTGTQGAANVAGGALVMQTGGTITNQNSIIAKYNTFSLLPGKRAAFEAVFQCNNASLSAFFVGFADAVMTDTDCRPANGVGFTKVAGATAINLVHSVGGVDTVSAGKGTFATDTEVSLALLWDGIKASFYIDGDWVGDLQPTTVASALLGPCIMARNGSGAARLFMVNAVQAAQTF